MNRDIDAELASFPHYHIAGADDSIVISTFTSLEKFLYYAG